MKQIITALLIALILISGCSKGTIVAKPVSEATAEVVLEANVTENPCENVLCDANSHCENGKCICDAEYRPCADACISKSACCSDTDCTAGKVCKDSACIETGCGYYQKYDYAKKTCVCNDQSKWCASQMNCIPKGNCCMHSECGASEACIPTQFLASVCIQLDKKMCRGLPEGRRETFVFTDARYSVTLKNVLQTGKIVLGVDGKDISVLADETYNLGSNATLFVEEMKTLGGNCREE